MASDSEMTKGLLSAQDTDEPPPQAEGTLESDSFWPVFASQESTGAFVLPLPGQEQLGLQQSQ